jgi:hypothetical protein
MMKSISQIVKQSPVSEYTGSSVTRSIVEEAIEKRWGKSELKNYDPYHNARTFHSWLKLGYKVRRGEKAIRSITYVETRDADGNVLKCIKRPCFLFYVRQVEPIKKSYGKENDDSED